MKTYKEHYKEGLAKSNLEQYEEAIKEYDKAIALNPKSAEAYFSRGNAKYKMGNKEGAREDFNKSFSL